MASSKQHYVPRCYLREWVDPNTPIGQEPYVWRFDRGGKNRKKKSPKNILTGTDMYTLRVSGKRKNYSIEQTLSRVESEYASIFRTKINNKLPLSEYEHIILCAFVATMLQRTLRYKNTLEKFFDELIGRTELLEKHHNAEPKKSIELKGLKENSHKVGIIQLLPDLTQLLMQMSIAFLCADESTSKFITSDDPCNLFNPDLQWQRFYGPGLGQKNVQLTLPLSPRVLLCMSWSNLRGYIKWQRKRVDEANRIVAGHCYEYVVSHSPQKKRLWFSKYPINFFFILKILKHKIMLWFNKLGIKRRFRNV